MIGGMASDVHSPFVFLRKEFSCRLSVCFTESLFRCSIWTRRKHKAPSGEVLEGDIKAGKLKLVQAWIEIHQGDLMADWELAVKGEPIFKIEPLR